MDELQTLTYISELIQSLVEVLSYIGGVLTALILASTWRG